MLPIMFINGLPKLTGTLRWASEKLLRATEVRKERAENAPVVPLFIIVPNQKEPMTLALTEPQVRELLGTKLVRDGVELAWAISAAQAIAKTVDRALGGN